MSDIVLSASVRQNLLSLQSTADLLSTTQNRLATGKKVNSALDNPTNFFTAQSLDSRASDINNLLDGIGNGVQVLQAANTGITSLQKLVDTAKSIANQALQTPVGYTKSSVSSGNNLGATATNLLGTSAAIPSSVVGSTVNNDHTGAPTAASTVGTAVQTTGATPNVDTVFTGTAAIQNLAGTPANITGATKLGGDTTTPTPGDYIDLSALDGEKLTINGIDITFDATPTNPGVTGDNTAGYVVDISQTSTGTVDDLLGAIDAASGNTDSNVAHQSSVNAGVISIHTGDGTSAVDYTGSSTNVLTALHLNTPISNSAPLTLTAGTAPAPANIDGTTDLSALTSLTNGASFKVNDTTFSFYTGGTAPSAVTGTVFISLDTKKVSDVTSAITAALGTGGTAGSASIAAGKLTISSGTGQDLTITDGTTAGLASFGLAAVDKDRTYAATTSAAISGTSKLSGTASTTSTNLSTAFSASDTITVNSKTISFNSGAGTTGTAAGGDLSIDITTGTVDDILHAIDAISGGTGSAVGTNGKVTLNAGTTADLVLSGSTGALAKLGLQAGTTDKATAATAGLDGQTLTLGATGNSTTPTTITFGDDDSAGEVSTLDELNAKLKDNNLQASINTKGALTITTTNDSASADIPSIGGSITDAGNIFAGATINEAVTNSDSQSTRASLVSQYNNVIDQIRTTAQDSSFNGINLLNGDQLKLVFNETGTSTLNITGVSFDPAGLGLGSLAGGTDFVDNAATNGVLSSLNAASQKLRSQASALGSNLSVVQVRQDFSKNLINVLQTGSSNLTLADTNEEAANSQALSTRQSIAVSALALANQSNQSVLQLLR